MKYSRTWHQGCQKVSFGVPKVQESMALFLFLECQLPESHSRALVLCPFPGPSFLGTALPRFRTCNPPWLRVNKKPWGPNLLRRQSLSPGQGYCHCLLLLHPDWPWADDWLDNGREDSLKEGWPKTGMVTKRPSGNDLGGYRKREWWTLTPQLWHSLSPHSVCKKSPNLLAALLPLPDLSLKQCWRWVQPCAGNGGFPRGNQA